MTNEQTIPVLELSIKEAGDYTVVYRSKSGILKYVGQIHGEDPEGLHKIIQLAAKANKTPTGTVIQKLRLTDVRSGVTEDIPYNREVHAVEHSESA